VLKAEMSPTWFAFGRETRFSSTRNTSIWLGYKQVIIPWSLGLWIVASVNRRCGAAPHSVTNL
jgi:hypothetical protein